MKLNLRYKIIATNLAVLVLTFLVISVVVVEGVNTLNSRMLIQNLIHQADISVISIRQNLFTGKNPPDKEEEFKTRAGDFALRLSGETGIRVLIFSREKELLADSESTGSATPAYSELDEVLGGNRTYAVREEQGARFLFFAFPVMQNQQVLGEVMFEYPMSEIDKGMQSISLLLLTSFAAGLVIVLLVSIFLSVRITGPVLKLKDAVKEIAGGNYKSRISIRTNDEVAELACAFNSMSEEIESTIGQINDEKGKLNSILESMGEGVIALDGNDHVIAINQKAESTLDTRLEKEIMKVTSKVRENATRLVAEIDGQEKSLLVCATPLKLAGDKNGIVLILNDITELRLLQEKQRQFVTNVSHELKTPLTTIMGYVDLLDEKGKDSDVFETSVHYLKDASDRLLRLVNDLIDLSCLSRSEFEIEPRSTDISALVKDITGQMALKAQKFNIEINSDIPALPEIMADPVRIKQAVVNILDNAIKYSQAGKIYITLRRENSHIRLDIEDTGCGIPADVLDKIYEPFYRVDRARSRKLGGNGLGLAITREIIEKHNGRIDITSTEGEGTTVSILLPV